MLKTRFGAYAAAAAAAALASALATAPARAEFPEKPVEMTVLFGGTAQTIGQLLADLMSEALPQAVVAVSRPGGGGAVGYTHVQGTDPDGYNIVWNSNSVSTSFHRGNMPFNYEAFAPIARISLEVPVLAVRSESGWESLADLVAAAGSMDGKLKVGISGNGSFTHLTSAALFDSVGLADRVNYIPYARGKAPVELLAGRIDAAVQWPGQFISHRDAGAVNILCVTSADRIAVLPDTPACGEAGADGLDITMWRGLVAPAGTPAAAIAALETAAKAAVDSAAFQEAAATIGFTPSFLPADAFGAVIASDDADIAALMDGLGLRK